MMELCIMKFNLLPRFKSGFNSLLDNKFLEWVLNKQFHDFSFISVVKKVLEHVRCIDNGGIIIIIITIKAGCRTWRDGSSI